MLKRKLEMLEAEAKSYGDGKRWSRGPLIGEGNDGRVFICNMKEPKCNYQSVMAVKSAKNSDSGLCKEKVFIDNLQGCPYILKCFGEEKTRGENGEQVYNLLLEYGSGGTLAKRIATINGGKGLLEEEVGFFAKCMLLGLNHIHAQGLIHRDLKPENIILVENDDTSVWSKYIAKIGNFGSAMNVRELQKMKIEPHLKGNIEYLSPESMLVNKQSYETDVWAIGCIVFKMLTGKSIWGDFKAVKIENSLFKIGLGHKDLTFEVPNHVSNVAIEFVIACFAKPRSTPEMLLKLDFIVGAFCEPKEK